MHNTSTIHALVLAGGQSKRMGKDKARIIYHQKEQMYHMADMLQSMGLQTFISINANQDTNLDTNYTYITDNYANKGALGGIVTAMEMHPNRNWLVVGCDYPMLQRWDLNHLLYETQKGARSLAYQAPEASFYLPTVAFYNLDIQPQLKVALDQDQLKLQTILENEGVHKLKPLNSIRFVTANTPEEEAQIRKEIHHE